MIQRILHSRHFLACLLSAATGMALYFRAPFPEDNIFLRVMALRSASAFLFFKYSFTLFPCTTPYLAYSILLAGNFRPQGRTQDSGRQTPHLSCPSERDRTLYRGWRGTSFLQASATDLRFNTIERLDTSIAKLNFTT